MIGDGITLKGSNIMRKITPRNAAYLLTILIAIAAVIALIFSISYGFRKSSEPVDLYEIETVGKYTITDIYNDSVPKGTKGIVIFLKGNDQKYPYWFGSLDVKSCEVGTMWTSTAFNQSDEKTKRFRCYPETGDISFYMRNGDTYVLVKATPKHISRKIQLT